MARFRARFITSWARFLASLLSSLRNFASRLPYDDIPLWTALLAMLSIVEAMVVVENVFDDVDDCPGRGQEIVGMAGYPLP